jgi:recombination protein RecT
MSENAPLKPSQQIQTIRQLFEKHKARLKDALPRQISPDKMIQVAITSISKNPKLLECDQVSLFGAVIQSAQLGLMPDGVLGESYLIPYGRKCNFQIGYKGLLQLVRRTGNVSGVVANPVYKGDQFEYSLTDGIQTHKHTDETIFSDAAITHFYAIIKYKDGGYDFAVMTRKQVDEHKIKFSKTWSKSDGPWNTNYPSMGKKTAIIQACKYAQLSPEVNKAVALYENQDKPQKNEYELWSVPEMENDLNNTIDIDANEIKEDEANAAKDASQARSTNLGNNVASKINKPGQ